jgi:hypothetical protein
MWLDTDVPATTNHNTGNAGEGSVPMNATTVALVCSTCGEPAEAPYRQVKDGEVVWGCVSGAHNDHADDWHNRPDGVTIRKAETWGLLVPAR